MTFREASGSSLSESDLALGCCLLCKPHLGGLRFPMSSWTFSLLWHFASREAELTGPRLPVMPAWWTPTLVRMMKASLALLFMPVGPFFGSGQVSAFVTVGSSPGRSVPVRTRSWWRGSRIPPCFARPALSGYSVSSPKPRKTGDHRSEASETATRNWQRGNLVLEAR